MSEEKRLIKNKKVFALSVSLVVMCGLAGVFGISFIMISNKYNDLSGDYDELYIDYLELLYDFNNINIIQIETLCNADTYVTDMEPDVNFGNEQYWSIGSDDYTGEWFMALFNFSLLNKPKIYEKVEIQLTLLPYTFSGYPCVPVKYFQEWDENTITYNNMIFPDPDYLPLALNLNMITFSVSVSIDVTEWVNTGIDNISIALLGGNYCEGYSREHPNQDMVPKLLWTVIEALV